MERCQGFFGLSLVHELDAVRVEGVGAPQGVARLLELINLSINGLCFIVLALGLQDLGEVIEGVEGAWA